jgi:shikimate kinase
MSARSNSVFLVGLMAVGKSTVGRLLADELGFGFYDSDRVIEERAGAEVAWIFDVEGENGFREREAQVIDELSQLPNIVLATGGGAVLREENRLKLKERGIVVWLDTPLERLVERTRRDKRRPLLRGNDTRAALERLSRERRPLYESIAQLRFCADRLAPRSLAAEIATACRAEMHRCG